MAPLVHMVFRQSRTLRDVIVTSCMLDLAQEDVSTALDLGVARLEGLLRAGLSGARDGWLAQRRDAVSAAAPLDGLDAALADRLGRPPAVIALKAALLASRRRVARVLPMLALTLWFALPMSAVAGVCAALIGLELHMTNP